MGHIIVDDTKVKFYFTFFCEVFFFPFFYKRGGKAYIFIPTVSLFKFIFFWYAW
ncbi:MAG: hypothetical protein ACFFBP_06035 [Promethearchaeota archaeon]